MYSSPKYERLKHVVPAQNVHTRRGGLVKVHDSVLNSNSQYKSLLVSARTTVDELIALLLNCYNSKERVEQFSLYECPKTRTLNLKFGGAVHNYRHVRTDSLPMRIMKTTFTFDFL
ncbi:hypothetical protein NQ315_003379 [Exocentrus adspersus]|uniref:Ras-associating domain-containing protein n=1 Tax=Exocentrus adspersus TaxID=1586481 RepID=A0AAV8VNH3_9CUCU|nr:hypothetical protein NQ315_003379 [Exocentrus adspersus]